MSDASSSWRERNPGAAALLDEARQVRTLSAAEKAAGLAALEKRIASAPPSWLFPAILAGTAVAAVLLCAAGAAFYFTHPAAPQWREVAVEAGDRVSASPGALVRAEPLDTTSPERRVYLDAGELSLQVSHRPAGKTLVVVTPHLTVTVVGTRFHVRAQGGLSSVSVTEGRVRVAVPGKGDVLLGAGEAVRSDDARLVAASPVPVPAPAPAPGPPPPVDPLAAQNALFSAADDDFSARRFDAAARRYADYLARFPDGALAPEAALGEARALSRAGHPAEADAAARRFLARFPTDARAAEARSLLSR